ncbi:MAG: hypothetical protein AVDCRST_MAG57-3888, partial [uncultured Blastococcus sp.]
DRSAPARHARRHRPGRHRAPRRARGGPGQGGVAGRPRHPGRQGPGRHRAGRSPQPAPPAARGAPVRERPGRRRGPGPGHRTAAVL